MCSYRKDNQDEGMNLEMPRTIKRPGEGAANTVLERTTMVSKHMHEEGRDVT